MSEEGEKVEEEDGEEKEEEGRKEERKRMRRRVGEGGREPLFWRDQRSHQGQWYPTLGHSAQARVQISGSFSPDTSPGPLPLRLWSGPEGM